MGVQAVMITGDNRRTAEAVARDLGIERVFAEVLPADKARYVGQLQAEGKHVAIVGDGVNDAPALTQTDIGIAIGAGTDVAIETAKVVLMKSDPLDVTRAVALSKATVRKMKQNLVWASVYNVLAIPVAAGVLYPAYGIMLRPEWSALLMSVSSIIVAVALVMSRKAVRVRSSYVKKPREEWIAVPVPDAGVPKEDVERARDALRHNEKCSSAGRRFWELSGGIFRCAQCGRALVAVTSLKGPKERRRRMFYYICATRRQRGKHACSFSKSMNAQKAEAAVWDAVTALLTDPENLKSDLEAMIEREKETRGDPEREARAWAATLAEAERKREKYQEMYAADAMMLEELRSRLETLEETRESARRELAELASWHEHLQALERDKELLLESYTTRAPEALDSLGPEEHRTVYSMLGLRVDALPDKSLRVRSAFGEENLVCHPDRTSTR